MYALSVIVEGDYQCRSPVMIKLNFAEIRKVQGDKTGEKIEW